MKTQRLHITLFVFYIGIVFISPNILLSQETAKKQVEAVRVEVPPKIDADLSDSAWINVPLAKDFVQFTPENGLPASFNSEVKFVYDDKAIYVGAMLYDSLPEKIFKELSKRDEINMADYFGVYFDCFNDYLTALGFFVTSSGVQVDVKSTENYGEDPSWDAVWQSEVKIVDNGWIVELKIPYSAIRFPKTDNQVWGLQIFRNIMRYRENTTWNMVDREIDGLNNQAGELLGIKNIDPPLRLSFVPYLAGYIEKFPETSKWVYSYNYGLDLKLGLNESYTLDMTLIPDFGQVQSDDEIYNLSPFEVYYEERRPFFMEGTELFSKGDVFYSRRLGSTPMQYDSIEENLYPNEKILENPQETQLINATKISGKSNKNLALGVFNGMTSNTWALIEDTLKGGTRKISTQPFTNYNMFVLDQALRNNSYVSFYNTNTYIPDLKYSANVTGSEIKLTNRTNKYAVFGRGIISQKFNYLKKTELGYTYGLSLGKISGNFTYEFDHEVLSDTYDPNDMGFILHNNYISDELEFSYNIYKPRGILLEMFSDISFSYNQLFKPRTFTEFNIHASVYSRFKNHLSTWINLNVLPVNSYDYFEPRVDGWYFTRPASMAVNLGLSPDYRKKFVVDFRVATWRLPKYDQNTYWFSVEPRFRVNDKLMFVYEFEFDYNRNNIGYVEDSTSTSDEEIIIFGKRNIKTIINTFDADYKFSNKSSLTFRLRHYWQTGFYSDYYDLQADGSLQINNYATNNDYGVNFFTINMVYTWNFAPGSEINIVWKNNISTFNEVVYDGTQFINIEKDFISNFDYMIHSPAANSFSIKVLYYLDYQYFKRKNKKPGANS